MASERVSLRKTQVLISGPGSPPPAPPTERVTQRVSQVLVTVPGVQNGIQVTQRVTQVLMGQAQGQSEAPRRRSYSFII